MNTDAGPSFVRLEFSTELGRAIAAYAALQGKNRKSYLLDLILDGIEGEAHAKMDLRRIPEIQERGGPKMNAGSMIRTYGAVFEPPGKLYNSKGLAARLGVSRHMIYTIKRVNTIRAGRGEEEPLFHGRLSTVERLTAWMDRHRDWTKDYHVRKPEPAPDDGEPVERPAHVGTGDTHRMMRRHVNQLHRFLGRPATAEDTRNLHGDGYVARLCGFDERLLWAIRRAAVGKPDNPYSRTAWVSVHGIRLWLQAHPDFVSTYGTPNTAVIAQDSPAAVPQQVPAAPAASESVPSPPAASDSSGAPLQAKRRKRTTRHSLLRDFPMPPPSAPAP